MKCAWVYEHKNDYRITTMCHLLNISRNSYYHWVKYGDSKEDTQLVSLIKVIFNESYKTYGTRRIKEAIARQYGQVISRRRIARIMKQEALKARNKHRFKPQTTSSDHDFPIAPNLLGQDFYASAPNEVYVGDITYIRTKEGWLYLATVIDLFARTLVGWAIDERMPSLLIEQVLQMAHDKRGSLMGAIFHSDRGSQYASDSYRTLLKIYGMKQSMSAKGNCYDNATAESFFGTLKQELIYPTGQLAKKETIAYIAHYIAFYNNRRLHSYNDYCSPFETELRW